MYVSILYIAIAQSFSIFCFLDKYYEIRINSAFNVEIFVGSAARFTL